MVLCLHTPYKGNFQDFSHKAICYSVQMQFIKIVINYSNNVNDWKMHLRNTCAHFMVEMHMTSLCDHEGISTLHKRS